MARKLRLQYPGAIYHVMNRGDRREPIFKDDQDRRRFMETLGEACGKTGWQAHAWCLMLNHFHLVIETPKANLVTGMKWFLGTYTGRFNRRHKLFGHLFSGRYKSLIVEGSGDGYLRTVCDYVHLNPVRAKLLRPAQSLRAYPWSSYPEYLKRPSQRVGWLRVERVLGELGIQCDDAAGRRRFAEAMEERRGQDPPGEWQAVRRGWFLGSGLVKEPLLERMRSALGTHHGGKERHETDEHKAERLVVAELRKRRWTESDLERRRKQGQAGRALANGERDDVGLDCATIADGVSAYGGQLFEKVSANSTIAGTDTFTQTAGSVSRGDLFEHGVRLRAPQARWTEKDLGLRRKSDG